MIWLAYLLLGSVAGLTAGLFGIGGGALLVPAFLLIFEWSGVDADISIYMAIGSSLACIVFSAISSVWTHHQKQAVRWDVFWVLCPGIACGAFLGVRTAVDIPGAVLQMIIAVFLIIIALKMFLGVAAVSAKTTHLALPTQPKLIGVGAVIGWLSAIFGIGGGSLTVPFLQHHKMLMQQAVATAAACGLPIAIVGALSNIQAGFANPKLPEGALGYVFLPAVFAVVMTSIPCAYVGAHLAHRLPAAQLKKVFAIFVAGIGIWIMQRVLSTQIVIN